MDIKDVLLLVPRRECVVVTVPQWWKPEDHVPGVDGFWILQRCLPGQLNAAAHFFDFLTEHMKDGFESTPLLPSLFRHKTKSLVMCSHVDDLILCGERGELVWLVGEIEKRFTISGGDVVPSPHQDPQEPVRFLKKRCYFTTNGVLIAPHEKYVDELVKLYDLGAYKPKATPDMAQWNGEDGELDSSEAHRFRSAIGTLLCLYYLLIDGIPSTVRHLAQFMSRPTRLACARVRHLIMYLAGTRTFALFLPYKVAGTKFDSIYGREVEDAEGCVEFFIDSDWAMIFFNGRPVTSWSRTQKSIALSSCESEYFAAVGGAAEGIYISRLWNFLLKKQVKTRMVTDSSSCRAFAQRLGVGKLKHVDTKFHWLQLMIKNSMVAMDSVSTLFNMSDLGTKKLNRARRAFCMFLAGMNIFERKLWDRV